MHGTSGGWGASLKFAGAAPRPGLKKTVEAEVESRPANRLRPPAGPAKHCMMTFVSLRRPAALLHLGLGPWLAAAAVLVTGCGPQDIRVYSVPKERSGEAPWTVPAGWEGVPGDGMRLDRKSTRLNSSHRT